jgi:hypothetical protein
MKVEQQLPENSLEHIGWFWALESRLIGAKLLSGRHYVRQLLSSLR